MATIQQDVAQIRSAVYGRDVREAIADGVEQSYAKGEAADAKASSAILYTAQNLTEAQKLQARTNIGAGTSDNAVLYTAQSLTEAQKQQARENIGAGTSENAVLYTAQTLTNAQKLQVKINVGIYELIEDTNGLVFSR